MPDASGPYIKWGKVCFFAQSQDPLTVGLTKNNKINEKTKAKPIGNYEGKPVTKAKDVLAFIKWDEMFINVPSDIIRRIL